MSIKEAEIEKFIKSLTEFQMKSNKLSLKTINIIIKELLKQENSHESRHTIIS